MKRDSFRLFISLVLCLYSALLAAQAPPQGINYQAVARDNQGTIIANQQMIVQVQILDPTLAVEYEETHGAITTNQFGLFNLVIGQGTPTGNGSSPTFPGINWGSGNHYVNIRVDLGSGLINMGTMQLWSVPYALCSAQAVQQAQQVLPALEPPAQLVHKGLRVTMV
jgi:hypothetical protein